MTDLKKTNKLTTTDKATTIRYTNPQDVMS